MAKPVVSPVDKNRILTALEMSLQSTRRAMNTARIDGAKSLYDAEATAIAALQAKVSTWEVNNT